MYKLADSDEQHPPPAVQQEGNLAGNVAAVLASLHPASRTGKYVRVIKPLSAPSQQASKVRQGSSFLSPRPGLTE